MSCHKDTFKPHSRSSQRRGNSRRAFAGMLLALASLGASTGCNAWSGARDSWAYNGSWNNMMMKYRNDAWANKAWHRRKHQFCNERHNHEFCEGFRAGYAGVADGGTGCTPPFPPRQYWSWKYQSGEGQEKVAAWYAGFPHGARAAEEDGIGNWTQIQTSTGIQNQFAQHGKLGEGQVAGMYPMPQAQPPAAALAKAKTEADAAAKGASTMVSTPAVQDTKSIMNFAPPGGESPESTPNKSTLFQSPVPGADASVPVIGPLASPTR